MFKKIILFSFILLAVSCGKDEVIIIDPPPPTDSDVLYEVSLFGFTTTEDRTYLSDSDVQIDGEKMTTDESGFFQSEKILIGQKGKVVQLSKQGYLPSFHRISNHNSLETVILNLGMVASPDAILINQTGGSITDEDCTLKVDNGVMDADGEVIFKSFTGQDANQGNTDALLVEKGTEYLLKSASFYVDGSAQLNGAMTVEANKDKINVDDVDRLSLFMFDEMTLSWKQQNAEITSIGDQITFPIDKYGWWTLAEKVPAHYATLTLKEVNGESVNHAEVVVSFDTDQLAGQVLYTNAQGELNTYFPEDKSISISLNNEEYSGELSSGFSSNGDSEEILFSEEIQSSFEGQVYACDFSLSDGYVAILSDGQHKVRPIEDGFFTADVFTSNKDVNLLFYSKEYELLSTKEAAVEELQSNLNNFLSCSDLNDNLLVSDGSTLLQDFDMCRVKIRPKETVIIGEREDGDVFLASFDGDSEGVFDGLIYFPEITDNEVSVEVEINIVLYDNVENKLGGFIKTEYLSSGEELIISFIGDIE